MTAVRLSGGRDCAPCRPSSDVSAGTAGPGGREERKRRREAAVSSGTGVEALPPPEVHPESAAVTQATTMPARPLEVSQCPADFAAVGWQ